MVLTLVETEIELPQLAVFLAFPVLLGLLVLKKVPTDVEELYTLFIVSLDCSATKKHVSHFSKSEGCVRLSKQNVSRDNVNIPLSKICAEQDQQMDDV